MSHQPTSAKSAPRRGRRQPRASTTLTVGYDGECELCVQSVQRVRSIYHGRKLRWVPYQQMGAEFPQLTGSVDRDRASSAIHVIEPDGTVSAGAEAILRIADTVPRLRLFARIGRLPIIEYLVEPMYRLVARHRHTISRLLTAKPTAR